MSKSQHDKIQEFIDELSGFAAIAEETLTSIEKDIEGKNTDRFSIFTDRMVAIRGTAIQLALPHISRIAELGEELSIKAVSAPTRAHVRKCVGSLWDALTTIKHLLVHYREETQDEQHILINRLEKTLASLGGSRPKVDDSEIAALLKMRGK